MRAAIPHLQQRSDFLRVAAARRKWVAPGVMIQVAPQPAGVAQGARVGYTASRKVGNSVVRNRARRRLRAAIDQVFFRHVRADLDYVLIARDATAQRPWADLLADIEWALKRLKAWQSADLVEVSS